MAKENSKFKNLEKQYRDFIPENSIVGIRLDGKSFHTFTKQYKVPYDTRFMNSMNYVAKDLISQHITGAMFAYTQSDEITLFFSDKWGLKSQLFFNGRIDKLLTTTASRATGAFLRYDNSVNDIPVFDARIFVLDSLDDVQDYMDWRRLDARKNAITMAASVYKSHKYLMNVSTQERMKILQGTEHETLPSDFFNGRLIKTIYKEETVNVREETINVMKKYWTIVAAERDTTEELVDSFRSLFVR